jgi:hypothetical protein
MLEGQWTTLSMTCYCYYVNEFLKIYEFYAILHMLYDDVNNTAYSVLAANIQFTYLSLCLSVSLSLSGEYLVKFVKIHLESEAR